jgi:hypothetical protein
MGWGEQPQKIACGSAYLILTECGCDLLLLSNLLSGASLPQAGHQRDPSTSAPDEVESENVHQYVSLTEPFQGFTRY